MTLSKIESDFLKAKTLINDSYSNLEFVNSFISELNQTLSDLKHPKKPVITLCQNGVTRVYYKQESSNVIHAQNYFHV